MPVETKAIIRHLEERESKEGKLLPILKLYQELLRVQSKVEQKLTSLLKSSLGSEVINERTAQGQPLITFDELALDWSLLQETFNYLNDTENWFQQNEGWMFDGG